MMRLNLLPRIEKAQDLFARQQENCSTWVALIIFCKDRLITFETIIWDY